MFGRTTNSFLKNLAWARRGILSFSYVPLEIITFLAIAMVVTSGIAILVQVIIRLVDPHAVPTGFTTLIVLILFVGGIQLLCLGVIGSYLAHIYDEVKGRPAYIVDHVVNPPLERSADGTSG